MSSDPPTTSEVNVASLTAASGGTLVERMGIELLEATTSRVVGRMPVAGNTQPYGLLHGGASVVLAETLGSLCAALHAGPDRIAVGIEINATHHKAVQDGWVVGVATPLAAGRSAASLEIVIATESGERVCTSRLTCLIRDKVPGRSSGTASGA
jgi:1,4-dihydroxy-2-naphthoyl-CoA hydrolase